MDIPVTSTTVIYAIVYLLLFRLSIVALGALSIFLGYRLFIDVLNASRRKINDNTEMHGKIGTSEFNLKNAAPGTFFAAFGALITIVVLATNPVEFKLQETTTSQDKAGQPITKQIDATVRNGGETGDVLTQAPQQAYEQAYQYLDKAIKSAQQAADHPAATAEHHALLATLYFADNKPQKALAAQQEAVRLAPDNAEFKQRLDIYQR